jgi:hypothetical protein
VLHAVPGFPAANGNRSSAGSCVVEPAPTGAAERRCHSAGEVAQRQPGICPFIAIDGVRLHYVDCGKEMR